MRISIRLDPDHARKLDLLGRATQARTSEIVKHAIDLYYEQIRKTRRPADEVLQSTGFIGCGEADENLSETYKTELGRLLEAKHPA